MTDTSPTLRERFDAKVVARDTGCIEWTGVTGNSGYGMISWATSKSTGAHRVAWLLRHGEWPEKCILHSCDNRLCVNTDHMRVGTKGDNNRDTSAKGRLPHGNDHFRAVVLDDVVPVIRMQRSRGMTLREIAQQHGSTIATIWNICNGRTRMRSAKEV